MILCERPRQARRLVVVSGSWTIADKLLVEKVVDDDDVDEEGKKLQ